MVLFGRQIIWFRWNFCHNWPSCYGNYVTSTPCLSCMLRLAVVVGWRVTDDRFYKWRAVVDKDTQLVGDRFKRFLTKYMYRNSVFLNHVLTERLFTTVSSARLSPSRQASRQRRDDVNPPRWRQPAGAAHALVQLLLWKFPGRQGRGQPACSWAAATISGNFQKYVTNDKLEVIGVSPFN